jgi:hypothetical protein
MAMLFGLVIAWNLRRAMVLVAPVSGGALLIFFLT